MSIPLESVVEFCNQRTQCESIRDVPGVFNGLQVPNKSGGVKKVGAAVDASLFTFEKARAAAIDFLIVHHGLKGFPIPVDPNSFRKLTDLVEGDLALYTSHIPLDLHPEIGNNVLLAKQLGLKVVDGFLNHEGRNVGVIVEYKGSRSDLKDKLLPLFPSCRILECGPEAITRVAIVSGSADGFISFSEIKSKGAHTLLTGEVRYKTFSTIQEEKINLYVCGHYNTEVFGVAALAKEVAEKFQLPWEFIAVECPL